jgi:Leucine-rich repeat (LRR) protein
LYDTTRIDLFGNDIKGTLPKGLGNLTKLELLDLEENGLDGTFFTEEVMSLSSLIGLRGSFNGFTGSIPSDIDKLSKLEQLWFADNSIDGTIPESIVNLKSLESIFGYSNKLTKTIPSGLGSLVNLTQIRLYNNALTGLLPPDIFDATKLETIRLDSNQLTGSIPTTVGKLSALEDLRLFANALFGDIPSEIGNLLMLRKFILHLLILRPFTSSNMQWPQKTCLLTTISLPGSFHLKLSIQNLLWNLLTFRTISSWRGLCRLHCSTCHWYKTFTWLTAR